MKLSAMLNKLADRADAARPGDKLRDADLYVEALNPNAVKSRVNELKKLQADAKSLAREVISDIKEAQNV